IVLMLLADTYIFGGKRSYIEEAKQSYREEQAGRVVEDVDPRLRGDTVEGAGIGSDAPTLSSRPERSGVEGSQEGVGVGDPSHSLRMTDEEGTAVEEPVV